MNDFVKRFAVSLAAAAFGIAGLLSLANGALVMTALKRGAAAGSLLFVVGLMLGVIVANGPYRRPVAPGAPPPKGKEGEGGSQ